MAKIKWAGVISDCDIDKYQTAELPQNATKMKLPQSAGKMMLVALPFALPAILIVIGTLFLKTYLAGARVISLPFLAVGVVLGFAMLVLHELLHAAVFPRNATVHIAILKPVTFMALCAHPLSKPRFVAMCLLPYILGIVPFVLFCVFPTEWQIANGILVGMAIIGMVSPYPDAYNVFQVLRQVPNGCKVANNGNDTYFFKAE